MHDLIGDLRYGLRALRRTPGHSALAVLALGLGIGATTAMFGAADAVVLGAYRGVPDAERVVQLWDRYPSIDSGREVQVSVPNFEDYREHQSVFERLAATQPTSLYLRAEPAHVGLRGLYASADLFAILGTRPVLGRLFRADEDAEGIAPRVLLTHATWQTRFGGDSAIVGSVVTLASFKNGREGYVDEPYEVIGVLPAGFRVPPLKLANSFSAWAEPDVVLPLGLWTWGRGNRGQYAFRVLGRLAPDVSLERAQAQLAGIAAEVAESHPDTNAGYTVVLTPLTSLVRQVHGKRMALLVGAAALLLLIACANVAGLLLGRMVAREGELAVRAALGAGRLRLVRQLLTEGAVLAVLGGAVGLVLAFGLTRLLTAAVPPGIHNLDGARVDARALLFALLVASATALLFGVLPALRGAGARGESVLRGAVHGPRAGGHGRGLRALVVAQVAVAFVLLSSSGLLALTLANLLRSDLAFDTERTVLYRARTLPPPFSRHSGREEGLLLHQAVIERLRALPEVAAVGGANFAPLEGRESQADFTLADRPPPPPEERTPADWIFAYPGYFAAAGIPIVEGRAFTDEDLAVAQRRPMAPGQPLPESPVIINDRMAERFWPGESALGQIMYFGLQDPATVTTGSYEGGEWDARYPSPRPLRIIGVARTVNLLGLGEEERLQYYTPNAGLAGGWIVVRLRDGLAEPPPAIQAAIEAVDSEIEVTSVVTMRERLAAAAATTRYQLSTLGAFALLATVLALVGLFGVVSFLVRQRTRELGVRVALGAQPRDLLRLVLGQGVLMVAGGLALGIAAFMAGARLLESLLYGVSPLDARTVVAGAALMAAAALLACARPALRAARTDPMTSLRAE
ncbi:MAG TPA: ADOP family duplicated permease [Longimicrobiales bacterium]|nr:ADOP family duplicated permease [Longimicrobiales bacterium]